MQPDLLSETKPPVMFHGARLSGVGGWEARGRSFFLEQNDRNVTTPEFDSEHEAARSATDDDDRAIEPFTHKILRLPADAL